MKILTTKEQKIISGANDRCECYEDGNMGRKNYLASNRGMTNHFTAETCKNMCCYNTRAGEPNIIWIWYKNYKKAALYDNIKHGYCIDAQFIIN